MSSAHSRRLTILIAVENIRARVLLYKSAKACSSPLAQHSISMRDRRSQRGCGQYLICRFQSRLRANCPILKEGVPPNMRHSYGWNRRRLDVVIRHGFPVNSFVQVQRTSNCRPTCPSMCAISQQEPANGTRSNIACSVTLPRTGVVDRWGVTKLLSI